MKANPSKVSSQPWASCGNFYPSANKAKLLEAPRGVAFSPAFNFPLPIYADRPCKESYVRTQCKWKCYYYLTTILTTTLDFLGVSHRISWKNKNTVYHLQIAALVSGIFVFEKRVKYTNEMIDDVIHSTQYYMKYINRTILAHLHQTIETWLANSSKGSHLQPEKFCCHGKSLFSNPHPLYFNNSAWKTLN